MSKKVQKQFQLKNGLKVLLIESHKSPVISVQMWVRNGSADEKKKEEGISHFIEHLVFKGTRKYKVGEIASIVEGSGGELNAYTSFDQTVFYVTISKQFVDTGLSTISEMMGFPQFDPKEIDNEREVVIEEIKRGQDSLGRQASQLLFSTTYKKHPYGIPVIGYTENIKNLKAKKIVDFYQGRYTPKNMFLIISGDLKSAEMKKKVEEYFSEFVPTKVRKLPRTKEPTQKAPRIRAQKSEFKQSIIYWAWKIPHAKHKDIPALDVLALILGQGDSSRMTKTLRLDSAIVNSVGAFTFSPMNEGLFAISIGLQKEKMEIALNEIRREIKNLFLIPPTPEEIAKARSILESEKIYAVETVDGIARTSGHYEFMMGDKDYFDKYIKQVESVTALDLQKVAKKYLISKTSTLVGLSDQNEKLTEKLLSAQMKEFAKDVKTFKVNKAPQSKAKSKEKHAKLKDILQPKDEVRTLPNGVKVIFQALPDTKLITIKAAFLGGLRSEGEAQNGLTELFARTWMGGTKTRTELQLAHEIDSLAAGVGPVAGRNSVGLGAEGLAIHQRKLADIYFDTLLHPAFPEEIMNRERQVQLEQIKSRQDNPGSVASIEFMKNIFADHPYSHDLLGHEETLLKLSPENIQNYYSSSIAGKNMTLVVAGQIDQGFWNEELAKLSENLKAGEKFAKQFPMQPITDDIKTFVQLKKEQSHVIYGFRGLTITSEDKETLQVLQSILAGQGGRLFLELRDKASLAYSVSPMRMEGIEGGYFGAYIGCSPEKVSKSITMMKEQFDRLMNEAVGEDELLRAQRYLIGRHDIDLQRTNAIASTILYEDIYGLDYKEALNSSAKIFSITSEDVMKLSQKLFSHKTVMTVVGPENPWKKQDKGRGLESGVSV